MFAIVSTLFAALFGAVIGSFLNVVIHRVPLGASVVVPGSHCPVCQANITWYDNIPVFSWLVLLDGKCRQCKTPISIRYTLVEALMGILAGALWVKVLDPYMHYPSMELWAQVPELVGLFGLYFTFVALLVSIAFIDLEHFIIPHGLSIPGILLGLASPWVVGWLYEPEHVFKLWPPVTPTASLIGALAGAAAIIAVFVLYFMARGVAGMGGGDVTLMAMAGAWLGWPALIFIFFTASIQGLIAAGLSHVFGLNLAKGADELFDQEHEEAKDPEQASEEPEKEEEDEAQERQDKAPMAIPFGPFIVLSALEFFFLGPLLPPSLSLTYLYAF